MSKKTCTRCRQPKGKGKHYVTVSVPDSTVRHEIRACPDCGEILSTGISNLVHKWLRGEDTDLKALVKSVADELKEWRLKTLDTSLVEIEKRLLEGYANA